LIGGWKAAPGTPAWRANQIDASSALRAVAKSRVHEAASPM